MDLPIVAQGKITEGLNLFRIFVFVFYFINIFMNICVFVARNDIIRIASVLFDHCMYRK